MAEKEIGGGERGAGSEERQTERRRSGAVEEVASNPGTHVCASFAAGVGGGSSTASGSGARPSWRLAAAVPGSEIAEMAKERAGWRRAVVRRFLRGAAPHGAGSGSLSAWCGNSACAAARVVARQQRPVVRQRHRRGTAAAW
ncbi:hypothetical protein Syun_007263 [Stephania yunnanensis]|uniref:Uncharacterized protein n=1 Tax=Stephania yunnanensis TaxID=152371 RepID=A0AAP0KZW5_9MAGN